MSQEIVTFKEWNIPTRLRSDGISFRTRVQQLKPWAKQHYAVGFQISVSKYGTVTQGLWDWSSMQQERKDCGFHQEALCICSAATHGSHNIQSVTPWPKKQSLKCMITRHTGSRSIPTEAPLRWRNRTVIVIAYVHIMTTAVCLRNEWERRWWSAGKYL
jgi:hypothetical protein